jgi:hypothetical protein
MRAEPPRASAWREAQETALFTHRLPLSTWLGVALSKRCATFSSSREAPPSGPVAAVDAAGKEAHGTRALSRGPRHWNACGSPPRLERIRQPIEWEAVAEAACATKYWLAQQDGDAGELGEREEVAGATLVAGHQAAEAHHPGEEALDMPAASVATKRPAILGLSAAAWVRRGDHFDAHRPQLGIERVAVVGT